MKALAIVALVFAGISIFVPLVGIFLAMFCSVLAVISFRSQSTLSGITFGINIINTAFLSPSLILTDVVSSGAFDTSMSVQSAQTEAGEIYWFYVGFHVVLLAIAVIWRLVRGAPKQVNVEA